jgi:cellobiose transport system permease protein
VDLTPPQAADPPATPAGATGRDPGGRKRRDPRLGFLARWDFKVSPYVYVAPFFVLFAIFGVYPMLYTLYVSLQHWTLGADTHTGVGFANFVELWHDHAFWNAVVNTMGIFLLSTVPQLLAALFIANLLNHIKRWKTFFRLSVILPIVTSTAVVGLTFNQLYSRDFGLINYLLHFFGVNHIDWRSSKPTSWWALITMINWRWTGYNALIYLAAMQTVPKDLYESASLDGAGPWRQFWKITVPMLRPTIIFTAIISTIGGIQLFGEPVTFTTGAKSEYGGTLGQFQTVTMYLYQQMFDNTRLGYAGAIAWVIFLLTLVTVLASFTIIRRVAGGGEK